MRRLDLLLMLATVAVATPACDTTCADSDSSCEGGVAVACRVFTDKAGGTTRSVRRETCPTGTQCVSGKGFAGCVTSTTPCDASQDGKSFGCVAGVPSVCARLDVSPAVVYYPVLGPACVPGNTCHQGLCVQSTTPCDAATFEPRCQDGKPLGCVGGYPSFTAQCRDGNACFVNTGLAGCGKDGTTCGDDFVQRCDGTRLVMCEYEGLAAKPGDKRGMVQWLECQCSAGSCGG